MESQLSQSPIERMGLIRLFDANLNRATEGLRVLEDYSRFMLDDSYLSGQYKKLRHDLTEATSGVAAQERWAARETLRDVGTQIAGADEYRRETIDDVLAANAQRVEQALRCLEEYGKLLTAELGRSLEALRYRAYTLTRALVMTAGSRLRLEKSQLYVLVDGGPTLEAFASLVRELVTAGVQVIQLRDKRLADRELIQRARCARALTRDSRVLFVMNDRPDLAALADADGVHVGQEELTVKDARAVVGPNRLVGVSTHNLDQARQAVSDGANYVGCGPTYPSGTKEFKAFSGLDFLTEVHREISLPAFAIGGITLDNLQPVLDTGFTRVAVSGAIAGAPDPGAQAKRFLARLTG